MKFVSADFEEPEYRGPLFNQLEAGSHLIWEPGQVFEKYIGIDRASLCVHSYIWQLHGYSDPLPGLLISRLRWGFIWSARKKKKQLPSFQLNLFIQAKRSEHASSPSAILKSKGMSGGLWKFNITPHQQLALEKVKAKLSKRALICYAAPVFHKQSVLYAHTINKSIVENSTFPDVSSLSGHSAWYYQLPGATGVANPEYRNIKQQSFVETLEAFVAESEEKPGQRRDDNQKELRSLATAMLMTLKEDLEPTFESARFFDEIITMKRFVEDFELEKYEEDVIDFLTVHIFCYCFKLNWLVVGR